MSPQQKVCSKLFDVRRDDHFAHKLPHLGKVFGRKNFFGVRDRFRGRAAEDFDQIRALGKVDNQLVDKAVELGFGQRVSAFHLKRVLRRQHKKDAFELVGISAHSHLPLLHRFKQRRLSLRSCAIDLIGQQQIGKDGAGLKVKSLFAAFAFDDYVRAYDVGGHQIGRELHAREVEAHSLCERSHEQSLSQPRHAFEQNVAAGHQREQRAFDDLVLADDDARNLAFERAELPA